jgi:hypothetical protein
VGGCGPSLQAFYQPFEAGEKAPKLSRTALVGMFNNMFVIRDAHATLVKSLRRTVAGVADATSTQQVFTGAIGQHILSFVCLVDPSIHTRFRPALVSTQSTHYTHYTHHLSPTTSTTPHHTHYLSMHPTTLPRARMVDNKIWPWCHIVGCYSWWI